MSWIRVESGARVNLDHIEEIQLREPVDTLGLSRHRVLLYPGGANPVIACEGSLEKCKNYMLDLDNLLQVTFIPACELVKCQCKCGCDRMIPESMTMCENCAWGAHKEQEVKAEAA